MTEPIQKPGKSKQDYETPDDLIAAVQYKFGTIQFDLAASSENAKAALYFTKEQDSLQQEWPLYKLCWLNPEFGKIEKWANKCYWQAAKGCQIIMLVPASIGSKWYAEYCYEVAHTMALRPRLTFKGASDPYPKDCMLVLYNIDGYKSGLSVWKWNEK